MFQKEVFAEWHMEDSGGQSPLNQTAEFGNAKERTR